MLSRISALAVVGAIAFAAAPASATVFEYTGGFQSFTAPTTGIYKINSYGAQGGGAYGTTLLGGLGAHVGGDFTLTQGDVLTILVGGMGGSGGPGNDISIAPPGGGGGGGSFVYTAIQGTFGVIYTPTGSLGGSVIVSPSNTFTGYIQLADAGGGGGLGGVLNGYVGGGAGQAFGVNFSGVPGLGGSGAVESSGPGAGYLSPGVGAGAGNAPGLGGQGGVIDPYYTIDQGPDGDGHGGFGGGGGGGGATNGGSTGGGGGGGGYSGGDGTDGTPSHGGYSYLADGIPMNADYVRLSGVRAGNGLVTIDFLSAISAVPETSTWGMMILGMGAIGFAMRRRQKASTTVKFT